MNPAKTDPNAKGTRTKIRKKKVSSLSLFLEALIVVATLTVTSHRPFRCFLRVISEPSQSTGDKLPQRIHMTGAP